MATYVPAKRGVEFIFYISLRSQADSTIFQSSATIAAGDFKISKDGGALANPSTLPAVTPAASKAIKVTLSATEMEADNLVLIASDASGAEWMDGMWLIQTTARQVDDLAYPATSGRSMVVDANGLVDANTVKVGPTGSGTAQTAGDIIGDTNDIQTRLPAALVGGRMDSSVGAMAANTITASAVAAGALEADAFAAGAFDAVWSVGTRLLTAGTNIVLAKGVGVTGFNDLDAAGVRAAVGLAAANLDTQLGPLATGVPLTSAYDFAKGTVAMGESYSALNAEPTPVQALYQLLAMIQEFSVSGTTATAKKRDGATTAMTFTLDAADPSSITRTS